LAKTPLTEVDKTFIIAIILIFAYLFFFWMAWNYDTRSTGSEFPGLKIVTSTLGALAGLIVGYYFGNRPAEKALNLAAFTRSLLQGEKLESIAIIEEDLRALKDCKNQLTNIAPDQTSLQTAIDNRIAILEALLESKKSSLHSVAL
jgi:hypothetical protein